MPPTPLLSGLVCSFKNFCPSLQPILSSPGFDTVAALSETLHLAVRNDTLPAFVPSPSRADKRLENRFTACFACSAHPHPVHDRSWMCHGKVRYESESESGLRVSNNNVALRGMCYILRLPKIDLPRGRASFETIVHHPQCIFTAGFDKGTTPRKRGSSVVPGSCSSSSPTEAREFGPHPGPARARRQVGLRAVPRTLYGSRPGLEPGSVYISCAVQCWTFQTSSETSKYSQFVSSHSKLTSGSVQPWFHRPFPTVEIPRTSWEVGSSETNSSIVQKLTVYGVKKIAVKPELRPKLGNPTHLWA
ncbi:hypothetical protein C8J57DRAFT_1227966 [Mycena rebaudengoi]|nr:hypothetical protein C8J57DRAFT_1227966 [Mycena rebaudengoi]